MKQTRHSLMAKGIIVLLSLLVLAFAFTFGWYTTANPRADAGGLNVNVKGTADFDYAIGFWTPATGYEYLHTAFTNSADMTLNLKELTATNSNNVTETYDLLYDYKPIDVTGNGVKLIRPAMSYGNWSVNTASNNYSNAEANVQYISFDLIVRAKNACTVSLDANSYAKGNCENAPGDGTLSGANAPNKSTYGNFSRDAIVGAVRVAFLDYDNSGDPSFNSQKLLTEEQNTYESEPALLWVPPPDLYLNNGGNDLATTGWMLATGVLPSTTYTRVSGGADTHTETGYSTYKHQYYNIFEVGQGETATTVIDNSDYVKTSSIDNNRVKFNQISPILRVVIPEDSNNNGQHDANEYYYGKVRIRIWLEGTDSESRRALTDGKFSISFDLSTH